MRNEMKRDKIMEKENMSNLYAYEKTKTKKKN